MSDLFFETVEYLIPTLRAGDLATCESEVIGRLSSLPPSPFHIAPELSISNRPAHAARHFDRFFAKENARLLIAAAYTEMNGFDINPDRWYCDLFAYSSYGGHEDYDWLCSWQSELFDQFEIKSLEQLQAVYASEDFYNKQFRDAKDITSLLVVVKFQRFMQRAASQMKRLQFPLLATAHEFDNFIAEFRPEAASGA
jgi:hypothetical protein